MITVVIPFCASDKTLAETLLKWIAELGNHPESDCLLVASCGAAGSLPALTESARPIFKNVDTLSVQSLPDESHPVGPNWMFQKTFLHFYCAGKGEFLWLEPDCVPLHERWLKDIEKEYQRAVQSNRPILANITDLNHPSFPPKIPSGVAVYPWSAWPRYRGLIGNKKVAWDIRFANDVIPHVYPSKTIWSWPNHEKPVTYSDAVRTDKPNVVPLSTLNGRALAHPSKDGALISMLRKKRSKLTKPSAFQILTAWKETRSAQVPSVETKVPSIRFVHCVERHVSPDAEHESRVSRAFMSWVRLYQTGRMIPCHVWDYPRDSRQIGDERGLPLLKDILAEGLTKAGRDDVIVWTNDDSILHPGILPALSALLRAVDACGSMRLNFDPGSVPPLNSKLSDVVAQGKPDLGRDLFAFRKSWLVRQWPLIPDMFLGELEFDLVLTALIRKHIGITSDRLNILEPCDACELPRGYVLHERHSPAWVRPANAQSPAKLHNQQMAVKFYSQHQLPTMIPVF
jgi:hypothetical protein